MATTHEAAKSTGKGLLSNVVNNVKKPFEKVKVSALNGLFGSANDQHIIPAIRLLNSDDSITGDTALTVDMFKYNNGRNKIDNSSIDSFVKHVMGFKNEKKTNAEVIAIALVLNSLFVNEKTLNKDYIEHVKTSANHLYQSLMHMLGGENIEVDRGTKKHTVFVRIQAPAPAPAPANAPAQQQPPAAQQQQLPAPTPAPAIAPAQQQPPAAQQQQLPAPAPSQSSPSPTKADTVGDVQILISQAEKEVTQAKENVAQVNNNNTQEKNVKAAIDAADISAGAAEKTAQALQAIVKIRNVTLIGTNKNAFDNVVAAAKSEKNTHNEKLDTIMAVANNAITAIEQAINVTNVILQNGVKKGGAQRKNIILSGQKKQYRVYLDAHGRKYIKYKTRTFLSTIRGKYKYAK